jgi:hypothetical protein
MLLKLSPVEGGRVARERFEPVLSAPRVRVGGRGRPMKKDELDYLLAAKLGEEMEAKYAANHFKKKRRRS